MYRKKIVKITILFYIIFFLIAKSVSVNAKDESYKINISMYPIRGDSTTNIRLFVTTEPLIGVGSWTLYIDYVDKNVVNGMSDIRIGKTNTYKHQWVVVFNPPFGKEGKSYTIRIVILTDTGQIREYYRNFKIIDTIPKLSWFEDLSDKELEAIRGPKGDTGIQGEIGYTGLGIQGEIGPKGDRGIQGTSIIGERGEKGDRGPRGLEGESYPVIMFYGGVFLSLFSLIFSLWVYRGNKK